MHRYMKQMSYVDFCIDVLLYRNKCILHGKVNGVERTVSTFTFGNQFPQCTHLIERKTLQESQTSKKC